MAFTCRNTVHIASKLRRGASICEVICGMNRSLFFVFAFALHVFFTLYLCVHIFDFMVQPAVVKVQNHYADFKTNVFSTSGDLLQDNWSVYQHKDNICEMAMTKKLFLCMVIFLHAVSIVQDLRETVDA